MSSSTKQAVRDLFGYTRPGAFRTVNGRRIWFDSSPLSTVWKKLGTVRYLTPEEVQDEQRRRRIMHCLRRRSAWATLALAMLSRRSLFALVLAPLIPLSKSKPLVGSAFQHGIPFGNLASRGQRISEHILRASWLQVNTPVPRPELYFSQAQSEAELQLSDHAGKWGE